MDYGERSPWWNGIEQEGDNQGTPAGDLTQWKSFIYSISHMTVFLMFLWQVEKLENENGKLQQELQDSKDQNELLEFRILELEVWAPSLSTNQLHQPFMCP